MAFANFFFLLAVFMSAAAMLVFTTAVVMSTAAMFVFTTAGILFLTASLMRVIEDAVFAVGDVQLLAQTFHQLFGGKDAVLCQQLSKLFVGVRLIGLFCAHDGGQLGADCLHALLLRLVFPCNEEFHRVYAEWRLQVFMLENSADQLHWQMDCLGKLLDRQQFHVAGTESEERFL